MTKTRKTTLTPIDMFTPAQTCEFLRLDDTAVLGLVNQGRLPAYNLGGQIRFKVSDVRATAQLLTTCAVC